MESKLISINIFTYNGVAPIYRRTALNNVKLKHEYSMERMKNRNY